MPGGLSRAVARSVDLLLAVVLGVVLVKVDGSGGATTPRESVGEGKPASMWTRAMAAAQPIFGEGNTAATHGVAEVQHDGLGLTRVGSRGRLGPHFLDDRSGQVLMVESKAVFRRHRFHRAKVQLVVSAARHRAAELGDRVTYVRSKGYAGHVREHVGDNPVEVIRPTSYAALGLVGATCPRSWT